MSKADQFDNATHKNMNNMTPPAPLESIISTDMKTKAIPETRWDESLAMVDGLQPWERVNRCQLWCHSLQKPEQGVEQRLIISAPTPAYRNKASLNWWLSLSVHTWSWRLKAQVVCFQKFPEASRGWEKHLQIVPLYRSCTDGYSLAIYSFMRRTGVSSKT